MESQAQPAEGDKNVGALYEKDETKRMDRNYTQKKFRPPKT